MPNASVSTTSGTGPASQSPRPDHRYGRAIGARSSRSWRSHVTTTTSLGTSTRARGHRSCRLSDLAPNGKVATGAAQRRQGGLAEAEAIDQGYLRVTRRWPGRIRPNSRRSTRLSGGASTPGAVVDHQGPGGARRIQPLGHPGHRRSTPRNRSPQIWLVKSETSRAVVLGSICNAPKYPDPFRFETLDRHHRRRPAVGHGRQLGTGSNVMSFAGST